jgi:hypothetical protein
VDDGGAIRSRTETGMAELFISYTKTDRPRAKRLVEALTQAGFDVFWDQVTPPGVAWADFIERNLDEALALLALWSKSSVESRWVRTEAYEALQQHKLLPVMLDDVRQPLPFREIQAFDLTGWTQDNDEQLKLLIQHLRALVGTQRAAGQAAAAAPAAETFESGSMGRPWVGWTRGAAFLRERRNVAGALVLGAVLVAIGYGWTQWTRATGAGRAEMSLPAEPTAAGSSAWPAASSVLSGPAAAPASGPRDVGSSPPEAAPTKNTVVSGGRIPHPAGPAPAPAPPVNPRCREILQHVELGEPVMPDEQDFLRRNCHGTP